MGEQKTYKRLENMDDKEFYQTVGSVKFSASVLREGRTHGYAALDTRWRLITIETNPERARFFAIEKGCDTPWVLNALYFSKKFYKKHNERLEKALSE